MKALHPPLSMPRQKPLVGLFTISVAIIVLNLYASQPLIRLISTSLGLTAAAASLVTTLVLLGYAIGLVFLVPIIDLLPNRRVIIGTLIASILSMVLVITTSSTVVFLMAAFMLGVTSTSIQMLVPVAAASASDSDRGRVVGTVQSGIIVGVLLSRPLASIVAEYFGWQAFFVLTAGLSAAIALALGKLMPERIPAKGAAYGELIISLVRLLAEEPILRRRSWYQFFLMAAFSTFWTAIALRLTLPPFDLDQAGIALFALAGVSGALIAPMTGHIADRGWSVKATLAAHCCAVIGLVFAGFGGDGYWSFWQSSEWPTLSLITLLAAAIILDLGVVADQTLGRIAINEIRPEARGRINGLYTGLFFLGGSMGAGLVGPAWEMGGWAGVSAVGLFFTAVAVISRCCQPGAGSRYRQEQAQ